VKKGEQQAPFFMQYATTHGHSKAKSTPTTDEKKPWWTASPTPPAKSQNRGRSPHTPLPNSKAK